MGVRFCPTVDEIFGHYLRLKNLGGDTSRVDEVISTVDIYSFEPFELPRKSHEFDFQSVSSYPIHFFFVWVCVFFFQATRGWNRQTRFIIFSFVDRTNIREARNREDKPRLVIGR